MAESNLCINTATDAAGPAIEAGESTKIDGIVDRPHMKNAVHLLIATMRI